MSLDSILGNIIAAIIYAVLAFLVKKLWRSMMHSENALPAEKPGKKATLRKQFFVSLFFLLVSLAVFCSIGPRRTPDALGLLKVFSGIIAGLSFIITWGAFDAVFTFYPDDKVISKPADQDSNNGAD